MIDFLCYKISSSLETRVINAARIYVLIRTCLYKTTKSNDLTGSVLEMLPGNIKKPNFGAIIKVIGTALH